MSTSHPRSANAGGDDLLTPVVAVLAHLGQEDPGPPTVSDLEGIDLASHLVHGTSPIAHLVAVDPRDRSDIGAVATAHLLECVADLADVAMARAATTPSSSRLPSPEPAALVRASRARSTSSWLRSARSRSSLAIWPARTAALSTFSTSTSSLASRRYLFTPMTGWRPESMRAWVRAAASSMRSFGMPASMALAIPPSSSTSRDVSEHLSARSLVRRST